MARHTDFEAKPELCIFHTTPFSRFGSTEGTGLKCRIGRKKVMNVQWTTNDDLKILSFNRGPWEELLLTDWRYLEDYLNKGLPILWRDLKNSG